MQIGELAEKSKTGAETLRFYDRLGLLEVHRGQNRYRVFSDDAVDRIRFIQQARELGFTLAQIKDLLKLRLDATATRRDVRAKANAKVAEIDLKIRRLQRMRGALVDLIDCCHGNGVASSCPILTGLEHRDLAPGRTKTRRMNP
jgi:MerR family copper efflux transcriptional regulator